MKIKPIYPAILFLTLVLFVVSQLIFLNKYYNRTDTLKFTISKGENLRSIASNLEKNGIIVSKYLFMITAKVSGDETKMIPGEYTISEPMTLFSVLNMLTNPYINRAYVITIREGLTIKQIARDISKQINIDTALFISETKNDSLKRILGIEAKDLEGFLFPETYSIDAGEKIEKKIIEVMTEEFQKKLSPDLMKAIQTKKMNLMEVIIMASIVDGETRHYPEMKTIAGVYYNRLRKKMRLEADPTVQYALPGGPKRRLIYEDLKVKSPYNTYLHAGLPPGPINNPGLDAIIAAVYPENHKYLYFVAKGDGSHKFAETYEQHKKNVDEYRKFLRELEEKKNAIDSTKGTDTRK